MNIMSREKMRVLMAAPLFAGIEVEELSGMLKCLAAQFKSYAKNQIIFQAQAPVTTVGLILSGSVQVVKEDAFGNRSILGAFGRGELFGEVFSCARIKRMPVTVIASSECEILLLDYKRILTRCTSDCAFHSRLIENMLAILAAKNILMNQKIECLSKRTTREKLLAFLSIQVQKAGRRRFEIPFDRQELADYLCVDRSAMSKELGKLRDEGLLWFHKNQFELMVAPEEDAF